jgi:hypothetical protein
MILSNKQSAWSEKRLSAKGKDPAGIFLHITETDRSDRFVLSQTHDAARSAADDDIGV